MIKVKLSYKMLDNDITGTELAEIIGIDKVNLSRFRTGKIVSVRFSTLDALCRELDCQPGDLLVYEPGEQESFNDERKSKRSK